MLPLYVDISETVAEFALTPQEAEFLGTRLVDDVVKEYMRRWNALVILNYIRQGEFIGLPCR